jgi:undecaprenyl diphosphate synthase
MFILRSLFQEFILTCAALVLVTTKLREPRNFPLTFSVLSSKIPRVVLHDHDPRIRAVTTFDSTTLKHLADAGLDPARLPAHIAVIMDGNGRWANQRNLPRAQGHLQGVHSVRSTVEECCRLGISYLTLYCLSSENWKRPQQELDFLMALLEQYLIEERNLIVEQKIRFNVIGRRSGLSDAVLREIDESIRVTRDNTGMVLNLAINYGGRTELIDAVREIAEQVRTGRLTLEQIDEATIASSLYTNGMPDPDLLIRTAGEMRVSNFLLWQISYAEIWVTQDCWPDFTGETLRQALMDYSRRTRRFGGLK